MPLHMIYRMNSFIGKMYYCQKSLAIYFLYSYDLSILIKPVGHCFLVLVSMTTNFFPNIWLEVVINDRKTTLQYCCRWLQQWNCHETNSQESTFVKNCKENSVLIAFDSKFNAFKFKLGFSKCNKIEAPLHDI